MIKAIIVDDEPPARRELRRMLGDHHDVDVVGDTGDLDTARGLLQRTRPDVIFLDIEIGRTSGFDLLGDVDEETGVVFVTAFDHYAVRAFEASAIDYLMKPVDASRLAATLERVRTRRVKDDVATPTLFRTSQWVFLDNEEQQEFLQVADITHIEADGARTRVSTRDGRMRVAKQGIGDWEVRLAGGDFVRVHRSAIVNLKHVAHVERWSHYSYRITMRGFPEPVVMSRRHASRLRDFMG
ncbi:MAG: response regulator [Gemmatimonadaceae bacterium]